MNKQLTVQIGGKEIYMIIFVRNWYIQYINYTIFGVMKNNILTQIYFLTPKISIKTSLYAFQLMGGNAGKKHQGKFQSHRHNHQLNSLSREVLCLLLFPVTFHRL